MKNWLDREVLKSLRELDEGGDAAFLKKILRVFKQESSVILRDLQPAIINGENEKVLYLSHLLKGMSINVGAQAIFEAAEKTEAAAKDGNSDQYRNLWIELHSDFLKTIIEIERIVSEGA